MPARWIDGKSRAAELRADLKRRIEAESLAPCLATVLVGDDPASAVYVRSKTKAAGALGIRIKDFHPPADVERGELTELIRSLNADPEVDGILLQLPLPKHLDDEELLAEIDPDKDVDGFHALNLGLLVRGRPGHRSCTPAGCMDLLRTTGVDLAGKHAVVVGRSNIVGKPLALMLLAANATVTVCHSKTADLAGVCRQADVLAAAVGRAEMIRGDWIKPGAVVIDVGMNRRGDGTLAGDVCTAAAAERAAFITPVPGGVGPMTIAYLMHNTVQAFRRRRGAAAAGGIAPPAGA